ncbi:hypothetical protein [Streptomyces sp. NPDC101455]|uniref:hypothetical protein n=1 Tax=Streptomyces sp. NPDC101455 TaxID=3366142 RepID=UPI0038146B8A
MNDPSTPGAEDNGEERGQEPELSQGDATIDLPDFMRSISQTTAWINSINETVEPMRRHIRDQESARRTIESVMGPGNALYQTVRDTQRQYRSLVEPVLALQSDLSDIFDWHSHIADVISSFSIPRTLLNQLADSAALFLPGNLIGLDADDLDMLLDLGEEDGLSLAWAPRTEIVNALLLLGTRAERYAFLADRRDDVLDDVDGSLQLVTHPALTGMAAILGAATRTARNGSDEGAQALAGNVLETAMKNYGNAWIRCSFPQVAYPQGPGHHRTIGSLLDTPNYWGNLTLPQFAPYLVAAGMRNAFAPGDTQDTFNRHLGVHQASPDTYRPEFALPAILLAHALLRALNQGLERPDDTQDNA